MELSIEVSASQQSRIHDHAQEQYLHSVVVEDNISSDQAEVFQSALETHSDTQVVFSIVHPGDLIYGVFAEYYQFTFYAKRDMSADLEDIFEEAWAEATSV